MLNYNKSFFSTQYSDSVPVVAGHSRHFWFNYIKNILGFDVDLDEETINLYVHRCLLLWQHFPMFRSWPIPLQKQVIRGYALHEDVVDKFFEELIGLLGMDNIILQNIDVFEFLINFFDQMHYFISWRDRERFRQMLYSYWDESFASFYDRRFDQLKFEEFRKTDFAKRLPLEMERVIGSYF